MATLNDVRRLAMALPEVAEHQSYGGQSSWTVKGKGFVWERPLRKSDLKELGDNAPSGPILGVRTEDLDMKDAMLASEPGIFYYVAFRRLSKRTGPPKQDRSKTAQASDYRCVANARA